MEHYKAQYCSHVTIATIAIANYRRKVKKLELMSDTNGNEEENSI